MARRRGIAFVLTFILMATLVSFAGIVVLYLMAGRGPSVAEQATLVLRPGGELVDVRPGDVVGQVLGRAVAIKCVTSNVELAAVAPPEPDLVAQARRIFADDLVDVAEVE